jgi:hypothetical protein
LIVYEAIRVKFMIKKRLQENIDNNKNNKTKKGSEEGKIK